MVAYLHKTRDEATEPFNHLMNNHVISKALEGLDPSKTEEALNPDRHESEQKTFRDLHEALDALIVRQIR